jgi:16S rRNA (cytidine1402-2'-O)-methyltransferase
LLTHAGISGKRLLSLHAHNEDDRIDEVLALVEAGATVAVVSDAGTPAISDPGQRLVAAAVQAGADVSVVPGPAAVVAALVVSGLPTDRFCFEGFLPRSGQARARRLADVSSEERTFVLYEAPGRVPATLVDLANVCGGERPVAVVREITKVHEEVWRGTLADGATWAESRMLRGEVVLVVGGAPPRQPVLVTDDELLGDLAIRMAEGERLRGAVDAVAGGRSVPRRRVYDLAIEMRGRSTGPS